MPWLNCDSRLPSTRRLGFESCYIAFHADSVMPQCGLSATRLAGVIKRLWVRFIVTTLGKLLAHACVCHQSGRPHNLVPSQEVNSKFCDALTLCPGPCQVRGRVKEMSASERSTWGIRELRFCWKCNSFWDHRTTQVMRCGGEGVQLLDCVCNISTSVLTSCAVHEWTWLMKLRN